MSLTLKKYLLLDANLMLTYYNTILTPKNNK